MIEKNVMGALLACLPDKRDQEFLRAQDPQSNFRFEELDMTSLRMVEVCMHLEQSLGLDIDLEEFEDAETFRDLVNVCKQLLEAQ
jgi:acyl carrier protein